MHLRSVFSGLAILAVIAGCESSTDPFIGVGGGGGGSLTAADASGDWSITLTRNSSLPCSGALANGSVIPAHISVSNDGTLTNLSTWRNPVSGAVQTSLSGSVNLSTGALNLTFGTASGAMELIPGTMSSAGTITGATVTDPAPGFGQAFGTNGCQYTATGTKVG
ncbi:MAG: hypothetical protein ACJ79J_10535 [Gemmatimonadaceae bacterium]